jgi:hypothetical protein
MKRRVNFFIVGAPKCGTTAWVSYLSDHEKIAFSVAKEPHHFSTDLNGTKIADTRDKYEALFEHVRNESVIGDASVMHLYSRVAAGKIRDYNPHARILILLRDHLDFLVSYHNQSLFTGFEDLEDLGTAWDLWDVRQEGENLPATCTDPAFVNYAELACFYPQVKRFWDEFPRAQIKVKWLDEWKADPRSFYVELMEFLGIDDDGRTHFPVVHTAHAHRMKMVGEITADPPTWIKQCARILKRALGLKRLKIARRIRQFNTRDVKPRTPPEEFCQRIRATYASDRPAIERLLTSQPESTACDSSCCTS